MIISADTTDALARWWVRQNIAVNTARKPIAMTRRTPHAIAVVTDANSDIQEATATMKNVSIRYCAI